MKTVLTTGCFDLFHPGHVDYLRNITKAFPYFIRVVGLGDDATVRKLKGPDRPVISQDERKIMLEACRYVDEVHIFSAFLDDIDEIQAGHEALLDKVNPDVFVTGPRSPNQHIERFLKPRDIPLRVVDANDFTTTKLLERIHVIV
jgi:cytidyltransferase-like protein